MANRTSLLIGFLVLVIAILVIVVLIAFWIKPTFDSYVVQKQVDAQNVVLSNIVSQVQQNGVVQIPIGNQSLFLVPFNPQQGQQQAQQIEQQVEQPAQ